MATETGTFSTRRALLGAAIGGAAAVAVQAAAPLAARAADDANAILGTANTSTKPTSFENTDAAEVSLAGLHAGTGTGVQGQSATGTAMAGTSTDATPATFAAGSYRTGVMGVAGGTATMPMTTDETGVFGHADVSESSTGVWGDSANGYGVYGYGFWGVYGAGVFATVGDTDATGIGVYGFSGSVDLPAPDQYGVGVYAGAGTTSQVALYVDGKVKFTRSKRVSIGASKTSLKVTMTGVTTSSYILATMQTNVSGCYVRAVVPGSGYFTIYLSKAPGKTAYIGYMVIN